MELEDAFRKRARASGVVDGTSAGGPDRLSSLPDCLLHTIMSSLKARQVVQTSVPSTRWRHLWRSVPCLDIDFDEFNNKAPLLTATSSVSPVATTVLSPTMIPLILTVTVGNRILSTSPSTRTGRILRILP